MKRSVNEWTEDVIGLAKPKMTLKKPGTRAADARQKYNISLLKDTQIKQEYTLTLRNNFQIPQDLQDVEDTIERYWHKMKEAVTCQVVLGRIKTKRTDWTLADTLVKLNMPSDRNVSGILCHFY